MTSMVPAVNESVADDPEDDGLGRIIVGPKTVAKLCRDILLWLSY